jgi:hypothetical protein
MRTNIDIYVCRIFVFWKAEAGFSLYQKVNVSDIISLEVDILVFWSHDWLQKRTDPGNEG